MSNLSMLIAEVVTRRVVKHVFGECLPCLAMRTREGAESR